MHTRAFGRAAKRDDDNADYIGLRIPPALPREMVETACNAFRACRAAAKNFVIPAAPSLPERAHRPVHGRVQRENLPGGLQ